MFESRVAAVRLAGARDVSDVGTDPGHEWILVETSSAIAGTAVATGFSSLHAVCNRNYV